MSKKLELIASVVQKNILKYPLYLGKIHYGKTDKEFLLFEPHGMVGTYEYIIPQQKPEWLVEFYKHEEFTFDEKIYSFCLKDLSTENGLVITLMKKEIEIVDIEFERIKFILNP